MKETFFKCKKVSLKKCVKSEVILPLIHDSVCQVHKINILVFQFIKLYMLHCYDIDKENLPLIDRSFVLEVIQLVTYTDKTTESIESAKRKKYDKHIASVNLDSKREKITKEYTLHKSMREFSKLHFKQGKPSKKGLNYPLGYSAVTIVTMINNNIIANFYDYMVSYVHFAFPERKEKTKIVKEILNLTHGLSNDLMPDYDDSKSYTYSLKANPQKFLPYMMKIMFTLESEEIKIKSVFPQKDSIIPGAITLDTVGLVKILVSGKDQASKIVPGSTKNGFNESREQ